MQTSPLPLVDYTLLSSLLQEIETNPNCLAKMSGKVISDSLFLLPIPAKRNISLFTLSLHHGRGDLAKWILDRLEAAHLLGRMVLQRDLAGWTPVHHAAIHHKELYKRLKKVPEAVALKTPYCASPSMLRKITLLSKNCPLDCNYSVYVRLPGRREDSYLRSSDVVQTTGLFRDPPLHFSPLCHMAVETLHEFWKRSFKPNNSTSTTFVRYNEYLTHLREVESQLVLRHIDKDDEGKPLPFQVGLGVGARRKIQSNKVISNYGGWVQKKTTLSKPIGAYCLTHSKGYIADGRNFRSLGSTFNHSFPNARFKGCIINGNDETLVITIAQLEEEEEVCVSYGDGYEFPQVVVELRPKAMGRFVKDHPFDELVLLHLKKEKTSLNEEEKNIYIQWTYILDDVPTRFLQLILKGFIPFHHIEIFLTRFPHTFYVEPKAVKLCLELAKAEPQRAQKLASLLTKRAYTETELQVINGKLNSQAES